MRSPRAASVPSAMTIRSIGFFLRFNANRYSLSGLLRPALYCMPDMSVVHDLSRRRLRSDYETEFCWFFVMNSCSIFIALYWWFTLRIQNEYMYHICYYIKTVLIDAQVYIDMILYRFIRVTYRYPGMRRDSLIADFVAWPVRRWEDPLRMRNDPAYHVTKITAILEHVCC